MSLYDYQASQAIAAEDYPFYALIMGAMRKADNTNMVKLTIAFPEVGKELQARYDAPAGLLNGEND
jgi:hypothetical protein